MRLDRLVQGLADAMRDQHETISTTMPKRGHVCSDGHHGATSWLALLGKSRDFRTLLPTGGKEPGT